MPRTSPPGSQTRWMRVALVTGTVGIGKSTVGYAVAERGSGRGFSTAFIDVDQLSRLWPAPDGDPFRTGLILANLTSIVGNYRAAGAELLVLAWVITELRDLADLEAAVGTPVEAIRLVAPGSVVEARLRQRHQGTEAGGLAWHVHRAPQLAKIQERHLDLPMINASGPVTEIAAAVLDLLG